MCDCLLIMVMMCLKMSEGFLLSFSMLCYVFGCWVVGQHETEIVIWYEFLRRFQ